MDVPSPTHRVLTFWRERQGMHEPEEHVDEAQPRVLWGIRGRILLWFIAILSAATIAAVLVTRQLLIAGVDARIDESLVQEAEELRRSPADATR